MTKEQIVEKIQRLRMEKGYSMNRLATLSGMAYTNYHRLETKKTDMTIQTLQKICKALGISMRDFFDESVEHIPDRQKVYLVSWMSQNERLHTSCVLEENLELVVKHIRSMICEIIAISEINENIKKFLEK